MAAWRLHLLKEASCRDSFSLWEGRPERKEKPRTAERRRGGKKNRAGAQGSNRERPGEEPGRDCAVKQSQHVQKEGADDGIGLLLRYRRDAELTKWFLKATSTQTNVCQDTTILLSQELPPSRNVWDAAKGNEMSTFAAGANGHHSSQPFGVASVDGTGEGKCSAWEPSGEQNLLLLFGGRKLWQRL
ncbi:hypothetical protein llap_13571 [Limosa lapponica baueri]|uniref:Uncharacterized protein n=1 Tax=Limosa lapponica baueri TaxID=1758121 RepID=A0A2I0TQQ9_LIMLA|nr:hypothetical protein llap_13571 [Limosa lapponica baueri]